MVFVGSHLGDSQVVRIRSDAYPQHLHPGPPILGLKHITPNDLLKAPSVTKGKGKAVETGDGKGSSKGKIVASPGSYIEVLSSWTNISPILDAVLADTDGSGLVCGMSCATLGIILTTDTGTNLYCVWWNEHRKYPRHP